VLRYGAIPRELNEGANLPSTFEVTNALDFRARRGESNLLETHGWSQESPGGHGDFIGSALTRGPIVSRNRAASRTASASPRTIPLQFRPRDEVRPGETRLVFDPPWVAVRPCPIDADVRLRRGPSACSR
jgi:hypothetical protein